MFFDLNCCNRFHFVKSGLTVYGVKSQFAVLLRLAVPATSLNSEVNFKQVRHAGTTLWLGAAWNWGELHEEVFTK